MLEKTNIYQFLNNFRAHLYNIVIKFMSIIENEFKLNIKIRITKF